MISLSIKTHNSKIIEPCYIGENVVLNNSTVGPNVSIGNNCVIENATISNSFIQTHTTIKNANLKEAMIGNHVSYDGDFKAVSLGDYSVLE